MLVRIRYPIGYGVQARDVSPFPKHAVVGVPFYCNQPLAVQQLVYKPNMCNTLHSGVVDAEHIALSDRGGITTFCPDGTTAGEKRRTPGIPWLGIPRFAETPADVGGAPGMTCTEVTVAEVFLHTCAVVSSRGFLHPKFGQIDAP